MKKIINNHIYFIQFFCMAVIFILFSACEEDMEGPPVITEIRNYAETPNDTTVQTLSTGQWVVLMGKNLLGVSEVYFGGIPATLNNTFFTDASILFG